MLKRKSTGGEENLKRRSLTSFGGSRNSSLKNTHLKLTYEKFPQNFPEKED